MYVPPPGPTNIDPELLAKHGHRASIKERFQGTLLVVGGLILLLVVLSIIGALL